MVTSPQHSVEISVVSPHRGAPISDPLVDSLQTSHEVIAANENNDSDNAKEEDNDDDDADGIRESETFFFSSVEQSVLANRNSSVMSNYNSSRRFRFTRCLPDGESDPCLLGDLESLESHSDNELDMIGETSSSTTNATIIMAKPPIHRRESTETSSIEEPEIDPMVPMVAVKYGATSRSGCKKNLHSLDSDDLEQLSSLSSSFPSSFDRSSDGNNVFQAPPRTYSESHLHHTRFVQWLCSDVKMQQRIMRTIGKIRNSYFAFWLVLCSVLVVLLTCFALVLVYTMHRKMHSEDLRGSGIDDEKGKWLAGIVSHDDSENELAKLHRCESRIDKLARMHYVGIPNIMLAFPVLFPDGIFSLYKAKDKRMVRQPYLQLCEMVVIAQISYMIYFGLDEFIHFPTTLQCRETRHASQMLMFYSAVTLWLVLWRQIVVFCRFLTHLKLQADSWNDATHTSGISALLKRAFSMPSMTQSRRQIKTFKKELYRAVARGDVYAVQTLLESAKDVYKIDSIKDLYKPPTLWLYSFARSSKNPLHIAVAKGNLAIVQLLLRFGFDVNTLDKVSRVNFNLGLAFKICTRILIRTQDGLKSPLKQLLCSVLLPPLHGAVAGGHVHIVRLLIKHGADVNALPRASFYYRAAILPPIFVADDPQVLQLLVANGANFLHVARVSLTGLIRTYATPLQRSVFTLRSDLSDYLLESGSDVALTPLHAAAATDNVRLVKQLLDYGVHVDALGERVDGVHRRTSLHWAAIVGKVAAAEILLARGANPNAKDRDGRTPLHWAAHNNHHEMVTLLIAHGATADACDNEGIPVVCFAAEAEGVSAEVFSSLLAAGASLKTQVAGGDTALHIALQRENRQTAVSLIKCGANMMTTNSFGKRAVDCTTSTELQFALKKEAGSRDIMISYTHSHCQFAMEVREYLENKCSLTCWMDLMDPSGIGGGAIWREEIARGIRACSLVLSVVCDGYTKSEWCLKELALAKLLRKPVFGLIIEEGNATSRALLESLIPAQNLVVFNDFIRAKHEEMRKVIFDIDPEVFEQQWRMILPSLKTVMCEERKIEQEMDISLVEAGRRKLQQSLMTTVMKEESKDNSEENDEENFCIRVYSHWKESALKTKLETDLQRFGFECLDLDLDHLTTQLSTCRCVILLVENVDNKDRDTRKQLVAAMARVLTAAETLHPRKRVFPILEQRNFLDLSKMYSLARSDLFYFIDGIGWPRSIAELTRHLRKLDGAL